MAEFDIERLFEEGYPGLKVAATIGSASDYWQIVEEFLPLIRDQMSVRFFARMKRDYPSLSKEDLGDHYEGHEWTVNGLLAGLLPGSALVALWSAFEQSIIAICKYAQEKEGVPFALDDLREQDLSRKLHQYLRTLTRQEFRLPHALSDIQSLRNLYAHHNGSLEQLSEQKRARIEAIIRSSNGITLYDNHYVVLSSNYLRESVRKIDECLTAVLKFVEARYPYVEPA
jgi:hypothetical protein